MQYYNVVESLHEIPVTLYHLVKPHIECYDEKQDSVTVRITDPPLFLKKEESHVALTDQFRLRRTPMAEEKNSGRYTNHIFDRDQTSTHEQTLTGLRAGSSGDILKATAEFTSVKASCKCIDFSSPFSTRF